MKKQNWQSKLALWINWFDLVAQTVKWRWHFSENARRDELNHQKLWDETLETTTPDNTVVSRRKRFVLRALTERCCGSSGYSAASSPLRFDYCRCVELPSSFIILYRKTISLARLLLISHLYYIRRAASFSTLSPFIDFVRIFFFFFHFALYLDDVIIPRLKLMTA